ncbi:hypothetical protein DDE82_008911 [Stemphylium lycopersici]|uniref:Uncharacterized protein n=1 Tax=Stemphylium lycopersici TaxID=183478 RepID=A0A364MRX8_STELY|nr:hypothetical protein TW65_99342 [Stemphylium lycopersici]RAQ98782.1 hypothetical protein DDE82_008911 [Stemphylium lycopersici]RAR01327.1 hypothetical protein DDE83_008932 [Stemphylium lycopersici]
MGKSSSDKTIQSLEGNWEVLGRSKPHALVKNENNDFRILSYFEYPQFAPEKDAAIEGKKPTFADVRHKQKLKLFGINCVADRRVYKYETKKKSDELYVFALSDNWSFLTPTSYKSTLSDINQQDDFVKFATRYDGNSGKKLENGKAHAGADGDQEMSSDSDNSENDQADDGEQEATLTDSGTSESGESICSIPEREFVSKPKKKKSDSKHKKNASDLVSKNSPRTPSSKVIYSDESGSSISESEEEPTSKNRGSVRKSRESPRDIPPRILRTPSRVHENSDSNGSNSSASESKSELLRKNKKFRARQETQSLLTTPRSSGSGRYTSRMGSGSPDMRIERSGETPPPRPGGKIIYGRTYSGVPKAIVKRGDSYDIEEVNGPLERCKSTQKNRIGFSLDVDKTFFSYHAMNKEEYTTKFEVVGCAAKWHGWPKAWIYFVIKILDKTLREKLNDDREKKGETYRGPLICDLSTFKKAVRNYDGELEKCGKLLENSIFYQGSKQEDRLILKEKFKKDTERRYTPKKPKKSKKSKNADTFQSMQAHVDEQMKEGFQNLLEMLDLNARR